MQAKLYLERINQEMINKYSTAEIIAQIDRELSDRAKEASDWGGNVWDKSCCIINLSKQTPGTDELQKIGQYITMRRERFGGLVWVRKTNAVHQVDEQAFMVLTDLDNGVSLEKAAHSANVSVDNIKSLISQLSTPPDQRQSKV
jgi:hypothetical protein